MTTYVIAGSYEQFKNAVYELLQKSYFGYYNPSDFKYVSSPDQLRGTRAGDKFAVAGNWYERPDIDEIHYRLHQHLSYYANYEKPYIKEPYIKEPYTKW